MQFIVKRDILLKSLNFVQGVVEKKNTLPILSNVLLQLKDNKLLIVATDLDIMLTQIQICSPQHLNMYVVVDEESEFSCPRT